MKRIVSAVIRRASTVGVIYGRSCRAESCCLSTATRLVCNLRYLSTTPIHSSLERAYNDPEIDDAGLISFGEYQSISSESTSGRPYADIKTLGCSSSPRTGDCVWIRGRVCGIRMKGKSCFLIIRSEAFYTIQVCHFVGEGDVDASKRLIQFASNLHLESIVDIMGTLVPASVKSCTQNNIEIQMKKLYVVSRAPAVLPFLLEDAARSDAQIEASQSQPRPFAAVSQV